METLPLKARNLRVGDVITGRPERVVVMAPDQVGLRKVRFGTAESADDAGKTETMSADVEWIVRRPDYVLKLAMGGTYVFLIGTGKTESLPILEGESPDEAALTLAHGVLPFRVLLKRYGPRVWHIYQGRMLL